jgi:geranylgeranyl diphosphate synthase, type I
MADVVARVDVVLADVISSHRRRWSELSPHIAIVFDELELLVLGGGKRLRPQFCHLGWRAAGGRPDVDMPIRLGAAIELLHVMALLHDDVIDDAATRRGHTTTHRRQSEVHLKKDLLGESRRFGEGIAVLIGDITYVLSDVLVEDLSQQARAVWNDLRLEMNIGQYLDTVGSAYRERSTTFAELVCRFKSAKYTIERPLHVGAIAADVSRGLALAPMLSAYGLPLGDAFQIRDDVLGVFGNEKTVGKPVGGDFREGKPTPMLAYAYEHADAEQRKVLDMVGRENLSEQDISVLQQVVINTGAKNAMEQRISTLVDEAIGALKPAELADETFTDLIALAHAVTQRDA